AVLENFYVKRSLPCPTLERLKENEVPQPYRRLLVHSSDMTPTLENFYEQSLGIKVLGRELRPEVYEREVLLTISTAARPVAYGAICIFLNYLPPVARRCVLEEQRPLGNILIGEGVPHLSWPQAFFRLQSDPNIESVLGLSQTCQLFGRRN